MNSDMFKKVTIRLSANEIFIYIYMYIYMYIYIYTVYHKSESTPHISADI